MQKDTKINKQKTSSDGLSRFERAQKLFQDIENIIEQELASTPIIAANYETNIARIKKSKRKRPGLIRNFNSKKNRQVIGGMEFDPESQTWLGNEDALSAFSPLQPALITNKGNHNKPKVVGKMTWDPKEHKWKGNEKDALKFTPRKPGLITPLGGSYLQKEVSGMVFDPVAMRWVGNDSAADIFSQIDTLNDTGFTVGNEFHLPASLTKSFVECANRHKASLSGWFVDSSLDKKAHLYAIRNMSILRVVRDVKQRRAAYVDMDDDLDINVPERDTPSSSSSSPRDLLAAKNSGNGNNTDFEDYDDLPLTPSTKLKLAEVEVNNDDWDKDFDDEPTPNQPSAKDEKPAATIQHNGNNNTNNNNTNNKKTEEEEWDSDFAEADPETFNKLKSLLSRGGKPFQEGNNRGSVVDLRERSKNNLHATKPKPVVIEEDEDGLELPPGPVHFAPSLKRSAVDSGTDSGFDDMDSSSAVSKPTLDAPEGETDDGFEEEEEDWTDVDVPAAFPSQPVLKPHHDHEDWDNDTDFEMPTSQLTLKKPSRVSDDDDDDLAGVEIPENFIHRLKK
jgi:hypothetical protein